jgi:hypothetical protein
MQQLEIGLIAPIRQNRRRRTNLDQLIRITCTIITPLIAVFFRMVCR